MNTKKLSDVVLVYDRYYSKKPNPIALTAKRVAMCCAVCVCAIIFVLSEYELKVNLWLCGVLAAVFGAVFSVLFVFVKKRIAIPGILLIFGMVVWLRWDSFSEKMSYFLDRMCLVMDGRFVSARILINHEISELDSRNELYRSGLMLGTVLLIALFALITAAGMFAKPHFWAPFLSWVALWIPLFISETFTFNLWIIPSIALYMGLFAVAFAYKDGLALKGGKGGVYRNSVVLSERSFKNSLAKSPYTKRVGMVSTHYSKYFSLIIYTVSIFCVIGILASILLRNSEGVDYTKLYDFMISIGERSNIGPTINVEPFGDYFTSYKTSQKLGISSPGTSEQEVLQVYNGGSVPVYLRGDYGIEFYGNHWTSPINTEPEEWTAPYGLKDNYKPAEARILSRYFRDDEIVKSSDLYVDYLTDTNVVFLPAYTNNFNYYDNEMFNIYGDFVIRVNSKYGRVNHIECTAMTPAFSNQDGNVSDAALESLRESIEAINSMDFDYTMNNIIYPGTAAAYRRYANDVFVKTTDDYELSRVLDEFLTDTGLRDIAEEFNNDWDMTRLEARYRTADAVCTYLVENFTYSLRGGNGGRDPIISFLTDTRTGHCALYATSMTLLLRELGIPARYCTGFVAPPDNGGGTVLRSRNLHAWCEVYLDELGWVTFDPTSASLGNSTSNRPQHSSSSSTTTSSKESSDSSSSEHSSSSSTSSKEFSEDPSDEESSEDSTEHSSPLVEEPGSSVNVLPYILIVLVIGAAAALIVLTVRWYRALERRALRVIRQTCRERKSDVLLDKIFILLEHGGLMPKSGELPEKFYLRAERTLRCSFTANKDLLEELAFGIRSVPNTECEGLAALLEQLYNAIEKKMDVFDKIKLWSTLIKDNKAL